MEFRKVKDCLQDFSMDEDTFEAARETCLVLGGKLGSIRNQQLRCYDETRELEVRIDSEVLAWVEEKDLADIDLSVELYGAYLTTEQLTGIYEMVAERRTGNLKEITIHDGNDHSVVPESIRRRAELNKGVQIK